MQKPEINGTRVKPNIFTHLQFELLGFAIVMYTDDLSKI